MVFHPVDVALQRVDFAVVGKHAEGLRQSPRWERVGRITLMEDRERRDETLVVEVGIEFAQMFGEEHSLVDQGTRGQRADIKILYRGFAHALFDAAAAEIEAAIQCFQIHLVADIEHDLFDFRAGGIGFVADDREVYRHLTPAIEIEADPQDFGFDDGAAGLLRRVVGARQEYLADGNAARTQLVASLFHRRAEEFLRHLQMHAAPVAGLAVGIDGAAMIDGFQRVDGARHDFAARFAVECGHEAHTAGIVFLFRRIKMGVFQLLRVGAIAGDVLFRVVHGHHSAASAICAFACR